MKRIVVPTATLAVIIAVFLIFFPPHKLHEPQPEPTTNLAPPPPEPPAARYPLAAPQPEPTVAAPPQAEAPPPALPGLEEADDAMRYLEVLLGKRENLAKLFIFDHFIQRFVVTVDNLPNKNLPRKLLPVKGAEGPFMIQKTTDGDIVAPTNGKRYTPFIELAEALDSGKMVDLYVRLYPLFQQAYGNLGKPEKAYFNDRLIEVIDHLLETPEPSNPPLLERPSVLYKYADADLEARSAGQKILLRMGSDNAARLKAKLRELRAELVSRSPGEKPAQQP